jgi:hypothetical protein
MISTILTSVLLASSVLAAPFQKVQKRAMKGADTYTPDITIHESCGTSFYDSSSIIPRKGKSWLIFTVWQTRPKPGLSSRLFPRWKKSFVPFALFLSFITRWLALFSLTSRLTLLR